MASQISGVNIAKTANEIAKQTSTSENNMMEAFKLEEGSTKGVKDLAEKMGLNDDQIKNATPKSLQLIAQQRYQDRSAMMNLLSTLIEKMGQIKDRIIQNIGR